MMEKDKSKITGSFSQADKQVVVLIPVFSGL